MNEPTEEQVDKIKEKFDDQEARFVQLEQIIATNRAFVAKHREALAPFTWSMYSYDASIDFHSYSNSPGFPKNIAKAFGAEGWKRVHDPHTCGAVNWVKTLDGVEIQLKDAETINPKLIEEVKLT